METLVGTFLIDQSYSVILFQDAKGELYHKSVKGAKLPAKRLPNGMLHICGQSCTRIEPALPPRRK